MNEYVLKHQKEAEHWNTEQLLTRVAQEFGAQASVASSFGAEDVVLIDLASRIGTPFPIFTLDTDFLFPETYELIKNIEDRYALRVERLHAKLTPNEQAVEFGESLWEHSPDRCCEIRKIEPLRKKLRSVLAWITGIRREQSPTRAHVQKLEWDCKFGLAKINPLADWKDKDVWAYIRSHGVPYNPLHDRRYPSIGCVHCTRAVLPEEDPRAGRWSGFSKTECGLHLVESDSKRSGE